jgi:hypothetical protein
MNITYFLGAGASSNCLPMMGDFRDRLGRFSSHLYTEIRRSREYFKVHAINELAAEIDEGWLGAADRLAGNISWLLTEIAKHQTIDTLAKKYFIKNCQEELLKLKSVVYTFFLYQQSNIQKISECPDKRYDTFIASVIGKQINNIEMPGNIKFITWNYDLQFELAYQEYAALNINQIQQNLNCSPSYFSMDRQYRFNPEKFALVRLNGVIGIPTLRNQKDNLQPSYPDAINKANKPFNQLIKIYEEITAPVNDAQVFVSGIALYNYDWEYQESFKQKVYPDFTRREMIAKQILNNTEILVIIGYSFPIFNRETDSQLFKYLRPEVCRNIYIQDRQPDKIQSRIQSFIPSGFIYGSQGGQGKVILNKDVDQFFLPDEFQMTGI